MPTYVISYDLTPPGVKHAEVIKRIRSIAGDTPIEKMLAQIAAHPDSTFIIDSELQAGEIMAILRAPGGISETDRVLIAAAAGDVLLHP